MKRILFCAALIFRLADASLFADQAESAASGVSAETADVERAIAGVYPALVQIGVVTIQPSSGRMRKMQAAGSGAIISEDGYIITNHHVAGKGIRFVCRMPDGEEVPAELIGTDPLADIAVLKLDLSEIEVDGPLPRAEFGDSDDLEVGDVVYAMGSPAALSQSVTRGIVSNTAMIMSSFVGDMRLDGENVGSLVRWIAHDAQIFGGNSGGPLVDSKGRIIGINEIGVAGLGGAIPSNLAKSVAEQLIEKGRVDRSWLGINAQPLLEEMKDLEGVLVGGVIAGSPAESAGLMPGDIIVEYDGHPVQGRIPEDLPAFNALVMSTPVAAAVELKILREGKEKSLAATTELRSYARGKDHELKSWGMTVRNLTRLSALEMKRPDTNGVVVVSMRPGGPALEAKPSLKQNDVILSVAGKEIYGAADLMAVSREQIGESEERVPVLVKLAREAEDILTVVEIGKDPDNDPPAQARKAWLPIISQVLTRPLAEELGLEDKGGVRITQLYPERSAAKAGLQPGDILLEIDGMPIEAFEPEDSEVLDYMVRQYKIGTEVELSVIRAGKAMKLAVELDEPQKAQANLESYSDDNFEFSVREISLEDRLMKQIDPGTEGVLVDKVKHAGWAALAGLHSGDILLSIDGKPTKEVGTVEDLLGKAEQEEAERLVFFVQRRIRTMYLELEPSWDGLKEAIESKGESDEE